MGRHVGRCGGWLVNKNCRRVVEKHNFLLFSLQCECGAAASDPAGGGGVGGRLEMEEAVGRAKDVGEMKMLVSVARLSGVSPVSLWCHV